MTLVCATPSAGSYANPVWTIPLLASDASATLAVVAQVSANAVGNSSLVNSVTAGRGDPGDTTPVGDDLTETITVQPAPAMTVLKTSSPTSFPAVGIVFDFSVAVINSGNLAFPSAPAITDALVTQAGGSVSCPAGTVELSATIICTASYAVTQANVDAGSVTNIASAAITVGGTPVNAADDVVVACPTAAPAITLDKSITAGSPYAAVGQTISYAYLITNTGNISFTAQLPVSDDKIATVSCAGMPVGGFTSGDTITCDGT